MRDWPDTTSVAVTLRSSTSDVPDKSPTDMPEVATRSYDEFLEDIKGRIRSAQVRAARAINAELIEVYWQIGPQILTRRVRSLGVAPVAWFGVYRRIYGRHSRAHADTRWQQGWCNQRWHHVSRDERRC